MIYSLMTYVIVAGAFGYSAYRIFKFFRLKKYTGISCGACSGCSAVNRILDSWEK